MKKYYKGPLVYTKKQLQKGTDDDGRIWAMYKKRVYDISDYIYTIDQMNDDDTYRFLPSALTDLFEQQPGTDITQAIDDLDEASLNSTAKAQAFNCLDNVFYRGDFDFRVTPRCTVQSYFLLAFSIILIATILAKFVAALQITKKRNPKLQDKFVICQVPCYTEGEESLKKTIDSLANLKYDDKRKLLFVICDGMIVGSGNDRPTPRIVLDILGVENLDPDPLLFKSLGQGNRQLNYVSMGNSSLTRRQAD
jgi:chitin synthase